MRGAHMAPTTRASPALHRPHNPEQAAGPGGPLADGHLGVGPAPRHQGGRARSRHIGSSSQLPRRVGPCFGLVVPALASECAGHQRRQQGAGAHGGLRGPLMQGGGAAGAGRSPHRCTRRCRWRRGRRQKTAQPGQCPAAAPRCQAGGWAPRPGQPRLATSAPSRAPQRAARLLRCGCGACAAGSEGQCDAAGPGVSVSWQGCMLDQPHI